MDFVTETHQNSPNQPDETEVFAVFASLAAIVVAKTRLTPGDGRGRPSLHNGHLNVSRQSPNSRGRKRTAPKVPAEFKRVIDEKYSLQFYITSLDGKVAQVYPFEEWERIEQNWQGSPPSILRRKILGPDKLLRADGRDGQTRPVADAANSAPVGGDQGRSSGDGNLTHLIVRNLDSISGDRGKQVHG